MSFTSEEKAEIRRMINSKVRKAQTPATPRKKKVQTEWDRIFKKAISEAKKEFKAKGGNWKAISTKYLRKYKAEYLKGKK